MSRTEITVAWKQRGADGGVLELKVPVIAADLPMIDRRLKKAGLRELREFVRKDDEPEVWSDLADVVAAFEAALEFFDGNYESLPFCDLLVEDLPVAIKGLRTLPENAAVRPTVAGKRKRKR